MLVNILVILGVGLLLLLLCRLRLGEVGLVLMPAFRQRPSPLTATVYGRGLARYDTRSGGRLMAKVVGADGDYLLLRRGNDLGVFRRLRAN